jgi:hypothetical protein
MLYAHAIQSAKMHTSGLLSLVSTYGTTLLVVRFTGNNSFRSTKSICLAPVSGIYSFHKAQAVLRYSLNPHIVDRLIDSLPVPIAARLSPLHVLQKSMTSRGIAYYCALAHRRPSKASSASLPFTTAIKPEDGRSAWCAAQWEHVATLTSVAGLGKAM